MRNLTLALILVLGPSASAADPDPKAVEFFESKIRPVLAEHCYGCHSADAEKAKKLKAGLRLDTADAMRQGGDSGPAMVPGKPGESLIVKALKGTDLSQMPPKGKLSDQVIADFEKWVEIGAPDPRADGAALREDPATIDVEQGRKHWAFQPPKWTDPPAVKDASRSVTDLDRFVLAKLAEKGLTLSRPADKRTLIRRVYFDLIGLPPTPAEVDTFINDKSPDAYERLIDKLLASPHYGERWARHWLDVARYSEDQAHTFEVKPKTNAWRYRDWVVAALNDDMPYNRFVRLQLAGDLVPESEGDAFTRLAGLGLLGLGAVYYKGSPTALADELDDKVDTVTRGVLGLTVSCARCHDHKYDPIPQRDYYSLAGVFNGCQLVEAPLAPADEVRWYDEAQAKVRDQDGKIKTWLTEQATDGAVKSAAKYVVAAWKYHAVKSAGGEPSVADVAEAESLDKKYLDRWVKYLDPANAEKITPALKGVAAVKPPKGVKEYAELDAPAELTRLADQFQEKLAAAVAGPEKVSKERDRLLKAIVQDKSGPFHVNLKETVKDLATKADSQLAEMQAELERLEKASPPKYPVAHVITGGGEEMKVFVRGNPAKPGEAAPKGFLQVLTPASAKQSKDYGRLELANAIASPANPLTARVIVNRVWAQHFGRGLVATPSNFGKLGEKPSHPELLDWLTVRFVENGWSLKWLHREILLSATYRQSSAANPANETDADNVYLWRANRRRLEVEPWRDALLAVSGLLGPALGGPTTDLKDPANARRTVYAKISRHELDGLLRLFDFPDANVTADKRTQTTVPQQQLFVLNSEFMIAQAKAFAARVQKGAEPDADRVALAYRLAYGRPPTDAEAEIGLAFLSVPAVSDDKLTKWEQYAQALLAANEFLYMDSPEPEIMTPAFPLAFGPDGLPLSRRDLFRRVGTGVGLVGLAGVLAAEEKPLASTDPLAPKTPHFAPKAKHIIHLFMNGGPSQVDTFDPKPALEKYHGQLPEKAKGLSRRNTALMKSPFKFQKYGKAGIDVSELYPELAKVIDDVCVVRSMWTDVPNHEPGLLMMTCGNTQPIRPSMGSWLCYGLGTENQNLPGFVVLCPGKPVVGPQLWSNSFLPGVYQGCHIRDLDPAKVVEHIENRHLGRDGQRKQLDVLNRLNTLHRDARGGDPNLDARIQSLEIAFRMQTEAQEAFDLSREKQSTREEYGQGYFADACLAARRLVERGVRTVQVFYGNNQPWDDHANCETGHRTKAKDSDRPIAALLRDLKRLGLLDETLVLWGGEFGRTPTSEGNSGRDHNAAGFSVWLAGGGIKGGQAYGATDEFGFAAVDKKVHVHDLHATILHLMGLDHEKLTYRYSGRDFRLTDVHGRVVTDILA